MSETTEKKRTPRHWQFERDGEGIVWLWLDVAGSETNALSHEVVNELEQYLSELALDLPKGLVIGSRKESGFIAGADIKEFTTLTDPNTAFELIRRGQAAMDHIESLSCPTLALINGFCLGGGLELALACDYRVALDDDRTRLALPEVKLGIHPGFGGTVRAIELLGVPTAMELMLSGRSLDTRRARRIGLVDYVVPERQMLRTAVGMINQHPKPRAAKPWLRLLNQKWIRPLLARYLRRNVAKKAREEHYPAPYALIELWRQHGSNKATMLREEARSVARLITGTTAQNLIRVFFLQERLKGEGRLKGFNPRHVHVIGGGVMGGDIAAWCALQGLTVTVQDRSLDSLGRVIGRAYGLFKKRLKQQRKINAAMDRLIPDIEGHGLARADVVIEAIFEDLKAKQELFKQVEATVRTETLLCTNTSSIPLEEIASVLQTPSRLVGLHFFNPVAQMQLVEIVSGKQTDAALAQKAAAFTRQIQRLPLAVKSAPGFLVNRVLMPYLMEAVILAEEGVKLRDIDRAATAFGMPMGPITLADTVGLDICLSVAENLSQHLGGEVPTRLREMVEAGKLGRKSGEGFYRYDSKGKRIDDKNADGASGDSEALSERMVLRYLNESAACLREEIVTDAELLDAGMVFATGFAPFRGGPMYYAREQGMGEIQLRLNQYARQYGDRFKMDPYWAEL